ncbi:hypothetical protein [Bdellovibrio sp. HCB-162]|uniref:hypothetical protein n=1 Tax=Bdellovibrio sp. HCB-162 TaxID=3394234 RepID=UPI0039BC41E0
MRKMMWKTLLAMWMSLVSINAFAQNDFKCGEYEFMGVIRKVDGKNVLKLYEGSMSEAILTLSPDLEELAEVNLGNSVTLKGKMFAPVKTYRGKIESMLSEKEIQDLTAANKPYTARFMRDDIKERVADPLHPDMDSGMKLIKELPCSGREPSATTKKAKKKK